MTRFKEANTHTAVSQTFLSKFKASDKGCTSSLCQSVEAQWLFKHIFQCKKTLQKSVLFDAHHTSGHCERAGVLHSAVHIWRKLKQMKTNTSFLMLLLVMKHCCDAFWIPATSTPFLPSRRTPLQPLRRLCLNKIQTGRRWTCILYNSSYINQ